MVERLVVKVHRLPEIAELPLPGYQSPGAAGLDLPCAERFSLQPGERALIGTGLFLEIPPGFEGQVRPRSGLALRHGLTCLNSPGTIDSDYRGEVKVILINLGAEAVNFERGERIAQLVFCPVTQAELRVALELEATERGDGGFGHTGRS